jgi:DNA-binding beta-propeller fold protein YncE
MTRERPASMPSPTGFLATLRSCLHTKGSGAPSAPRRFVPALLLAIVAALVISAPPALAARGHVFEKSFGSGPCEVTVLEPCEGKFKEPTDVAVSEATGDVYVLDQGNSRVEVLGPGGEFISQFTGSETPATVFSFGSIPLTAGVAVDNSCYFKKLTEATTPTCQEFDPSNGDVYVTDPGNKVVDKFSPEGIYLGQLQEEFGGPFTFPSGGEPGQKLDGVGVDASGTVWAYQAGGHAGGVVDAFSSAEQNLFITQLEPEDAGGGFRAPGFAIDSEDNPYLRRFEPATPAFVVSKYSSSGSALLEPVSREETSAVAVDLSNDEVFLDNVGSVGAFSKSGRLEERFGSGHLTSGSGLAASHANETVYVVDSAGDVVDAFSPAPPSKPTVQDESVSAVSSESATLGAEVNPRSLPTEPDTEYHFEYLTEAAYQANLGAGRPPFTGATDTPQGSIAPDFELHTAGPAHVQGLLAGTVYHYRLLATNQNGTAEGQRNEKDEEVAHTFTTQGAGGGLVLPDGRGWELVSPPDKRGAKLEAITEAALVQASSSGGAISYLATVPTETSVPGYTLTEQIFSIRGAGGWSSKDISPPHAAATGVSIGVGGEYRSFSEDLSLGVVEPQGSFTSLAPETSPPDTERTPYIRHDTTCGAAPAECFQPLVTSAPGFADVPPGTEFGGDPAGLLGGVNFLGASPDLAHVILTSKVALTSTPASGNMLYEFSTGRPPGEQLRLISVLPSGEPASTITELGYQNKVARHAVSDDGSRIVWSERGGDLYLRENATQPQSTVSEGKCTVPADACTVKLDAGLSGTPTFQTANSEVSEVFFTDGGDLYRYNVADGNLEAVTKAAEVQGLVLGSSDDASYVYFVANGVLGDGGEHGAAPGSCKFPETAGDGTCNLYVWHGGVTRLVAVLSGQDVADWAGIELDLSFQGQTSRVSPSGRNLAFMSNRSLTGYDNRDANSGKPDEEVYLYHAPDGLETQSGTLTCASCNPTGARPTGVEYGKLGNGSDSLVGGDRIWNEHTWLAANIPAWTAYESLKARYQSRYLSDSGRLFFNSSDALAPQDVNKNEDVYEYEPAGLSGCAASSPTFNAGANGCVGLITSGSAAGESAFLDASETGNDVFFLTGEPLVPQDIDTSLDVYDAHVCAATSPCFSSAASPPACTTVDACRSAPAPQPSIFGAPSSATFSGGGNVSPPPPPKPPPLTRKQRLALALKACHKKHNHRRRVACEKQAHKRYGPVKKAGRSHRAASHSNQRSAK